MPTGVCNDPARSHADFARIAVAPRRFLGDARAAGAWRRRQLFFERSLMERLAQVRGLPVGLHLPAHHEAVALAEHYARLCDGLLLQGGTDIDPARSSASSEAEPDIDRDHFELALISAFLRRDKAVLGICRGMQLINVAAGGTLRAIAVETVAQHSDPLRYAEHAHAVTLTADGYLSRLYGAVAGTVGSAHRQTLATLGRGLVIEAHSTADGCVEATRSTGHRYVVGVQWHPEFDDDSSRLDGARLISDFVAHAGNPRWDLNERTDADACLTVPVL
jgi:putative glutamine amidotransferase